MLHLSRRLAFCAIAAVLLLVLPATGVAQGTGTVEGTVTDAKLTGIKRVALRALAGWRYRTHFYRHPIELRAFHKLFAYQRPETTGF